MSDQEAANDYQTLQRRASNMYQVTFSDQSMRELNRLPIEDQLQLVDRISNITSEQLANPQEPIGRLRRDGRDYYRVRAGDFRCYFEVKGDTLFSHYILHRNTLNDFIFRMRLPARAETMAEEHNSFWKYLEDLTRNNP